MQVKGTVTKIRFRNDENGWTVCVLSTEDGDLTCVGTFFALREGEDLSVWGDLIVHPKYGTQLRVQRFEKTEPTTQEQLIRYLSSDAVPHIGPKRAEKLVDRYGLNVIDLILDDPDVLLQLKGIGPSKAREIRDALAEQREAQKTLIFLQTIGVGPRTAQDIYRAYGDQAEEILRKEPYRLVVDLAGIGFRTADRIARKLGVREDSILRTQAGLLYLFDRAQRSDGSCYLTRTEMEEALAQLLGERPETLEEALFDLIVQGKLVEDPEKNRWYLRIIDEEERNVAMRVVTLLGEKSAPLAADMEEIERSIGIRLDETQRDAVVRAATEPVLVLTGGPGTGKTTIVRAILELFDQNQLSTELAAPTGRAAKRLEQSTTRSALTLHRLLGYRGGEEAAHHPSMNEDNPLAADAVIVDEVSMVDLELFSNLCAALPDGCRLILVGDADQLPSVGAGNVLHDLIASDVVPVVRLDHIYRQAERSMIVVNAHRIRNGMDPILNEPGGDFFFLSADGSRDAADLIEDLVVRRLPEHYGFVPKRDIRVLSAMKKGECGVENLNLRLQQALNPPHPERKEYMVGQVLFREGDSVMQVKNDYDLEWNDLSDPDEEQKGEGVYNGDFGVLTAVDPEGEFMEASFDGRVAHYLPLQFKELSHSFAITIHKSQGSEFPCVVIAVVPGAPLLETRNIIYTAMTRARKLCVLVGDVATLHRMVSHHRMERRNSSLNERLIAAAALQHEMGF